MDFVGRQLVAALQHGGFTTPLQGFVPAISHLCVKYEGYILRDGSTEENIATIVMRLSCTYDFGRRSGRLSLPKIEAMLCHQQYAPRLPSEEGQGAGTGFGLRVSSTVYGGLGPGTNVVGRFLAGNQTATLDSIPAAPLNCVQRFTSGIVATEVDVRLFILAARGSGETDKAAVLRQETAILAVGSTAWQHPSVVSEAIELLGSLCRDTTAVNPWLRVVAATAFSGGSAATASLIQALISLATDDTLDTCVRCRCILSLVRVCEHDGDHPTVRRVIRVLADIMRVSVTPRIVLEASIDALAALGERSDAVAVPACLHILWSDVAGYWAQAAAIDALQRIPLPGPQAQSALAEFCGLLSTPGSGADTTVVPTPSPALRHFAAHVLHQLSLGSIDVKPALLPLVTDIVGVEPLTRELAASLLLFLDRDSTEATRALLDIITAPDVPEIIKNRALQNIEVVGSAHAEPVAAVLAEQYRHIIIALAAAGLSITPANYAATTDEQRVASQILNSLRTIAHFHPHTVPTLEGLQTRMERIRRPDSWAPAATTSAPRLGGARVSAGLPSAPAATAPGLRFGGARVSVGVRPSPAAVATASSIPGSTPPTHGHRIMLG
jgi:hypothetical protein